MTKRNLNHAWQVQSSRVVGRDGAALSTEMGASHHWYKTNLPNTVLGTLVDNGLYADPFYGSNILDIPEQGPKAQNFSNYPMPEGSPFRDPWWFRKSFRYDNSIAAHTSLQFDGINYRANIWLNGKNISCAKDIAGAYRVFEIDITNALISDGENILAIEVFPPEAGDIAITWVDWNPSPPDKNMGLWRDVWLRSSGPITIRAPHVTTKLDSLDRARLTLACDVVNTSQRDQSTCISVSIDGKKIEREIQLVAGEKTRWEEEIVFSSPKLWWPWTMGEARLYRACFEAQHVSGLSDAAAFDFGIREVSCDLTSDGHALFAINGEPILVRGAGWATDLFLRRYPQRDLAQLEYVKEMNLNTIRFEGMLERASFLEWCDREGVLVISGWSCCDAWEKWDEWSAENLQIAKESLRSQIRRTRRHPSLISWWYGSDFSPPGEVEQHYLDVLREEHWPNACHSSAADKPSELTGKSGLKMEGPYDYVPPSYWLEDTTNGGAFGFATEICPGPAIPPVESLKKMLPPECLWPIDDTWNLHAGGQEFHNITLFEKALRNRYGECESVDEFAQYSQLMAYEGQRAMFEAYGRNKFKSTGVIQWMLNNAWPSLIWHLFDHYLRPAGGYFATKKANEPLHIMYDSHQHSVVVINDFRRGFNGLRAEIRVLDSEGQSLVNSSVEIDIGSNSTLDVLKIPNLDSAIPVLFVDLRLFKSESVVVSHNFYWIPTKRDVLDHSNASWINTPIKQYADLRSIRKLPLVSLETETCLTLRGSAIFLDVTLRNRSNYLAFFTELRLADHNKQDILPIIWSDNYVSILPKESCHLTAQANYDSVDGQLCLSVKGINVSERIIALDANVKPPSIFLDRGSPPVSADGNHT
ncbi:MAG: glycosyl hydrolase family 2 [Myxococcota bacterium]|nr:glycosyl hydrolase family 2 [Myxococcota bacterium]